MAVNVAVLGAMAGGVVFLYAAIKDQSVLKALQSVIKGSPPAAVSGGSASGAANSGSAAPEAPASISGNVALGKLLAAPYGWSTGAEWNALYDTWNRESGWSNTVQNSSSGAYGIPQANPYTKMPKAAWPPADGGSASATAQIEWGLSYISGTYGNPEAAWAHEVAEGWY